MYDIAVGARQIAGMHHTTNPQSLVIYRISAMEIVAVAYALTPANSKRKFLRTSNYPGA